MDNRELDCSFINDTSWFRYRAGGLILENGCILFVGSKGVDYLYTVGGGVKVGECAQDCVTREVLEETGVPYEVDRLAAICENFFTGKGGNLDGLDCHCLEFFFLMKPKGNQELHSESYNWDGEREVMHWIPVEEIKNYDIRPTYLKEHIEEILNSQGICHFVTEQDKIRKK